MEFIELQADMDTKRGYTEDSLVEFYKLYVCGKFPNLSHQAREMTSLFGSTYYCELSLSKMKLNNTGCQSQLNDEQLTSQLRVATTFFKANIGKLCKDSKFQVAY